MTKIDPHDVLEAGKYLLGALVIFYVGMSVLEPQKVLWRRPSRKLLITFVAVWTAVIALLLFAVWWNR